MNTTKVNDRNQSCVKRDTRNETKPVLFQCKLSRETLKIKSDIHQPSIQLFRLDNIMLFHTVFEF